MAEAMHTGWPAIGCAVRIRFHCITLSLAMNALMGMPLPIPSPSTHVRRDAGVIVTHIFR